jgi:pimeloyl-ACP methyl ester carboxylesterase
VSEGKLPKPTCCAGIASLNDKVYITGGHDGAVYFDTAWMATINDIIGQPAVTPTPPPKNPVVFIPGMFACWNKDVILHDALATNNQWYIPVFIDVYDGLLSSLQSAGYEKGSNLYVYCYDWRKDVHENANSLAAYILSQILPNQPPGTQVDLVGHSMGGLIARATAADVMLPKIDKVITVGSPHAGATMAYRPWEGADFGDLLSWQLVMGELYLRIKSPAYPNLVTTAQVAVPSLQNLLPTYDYLKDKKGVIKPEDNLVWKNNLLPALEQSLPPLLPKLSTIGGKGWETLKFINVIEPSEIEKQQGKWVDGKPKDEESTTEGDGTVLEESAKVPGAAQIEEIDGADHGQLVTEVAGQLRVLQLLGAEGETQVVYPKKYSRAVVVALGSPATFFITDPGGNVLNPTDGILAVDEPLEGQYQVHLTATSPGSYTLYFGRLAPDNSAWESAQGNFSSSGQTREFTFTTNFNSKSLGANLLADALARIKLIKQIVQESNAKRATKLVLVNLLDQLGKMIQRMGKESGKKLEVYAMVISKEIDKIITEAEKRSFTEIVGQLRLIKLDIWQYLEDQE